MIQARTVAEARAWVHGVRRTGARLGFVPTMGALHVAHQELVDCCRSGVDAVVMSVFVNPTQFGPGEDYDRYPRDPQRDAALAAAAGVDLLFLPHSDEMYPHGSTAFVDVGPLGAMLEGAARPGHFRGVATVVTKLVHVLAPDVAVFGQKDAQQVAVVRRLVRDLLLPTEVRCMPTVRERDGLALSSRNVYLSPDQRRAAPILYRALERVRVALQAGERRAAELEALVSQTVGQEPLARMEYVAVVGADGWEPLERAEGKTLVVVAARFGEVRLLDNLCVRVHADGVEPGVP